MMALTEYVYVDQGRLDSYYEQISAPLVYDKVPIWRVALGLTGPSVEGTQDRPGRPPTVHEKLSALVTYLEKKSLLGTNRPSDPERWQTDRVFRLEICEARRWFIPPKQVSPELGGLNLWISKAEEKTSSTESNAGVLYLLERYSHDDERWSKNISSYSVLQMLLDQARAEIQDTVLGEAFGGDVEARKHLDGELASRPDVLLSRLGAKAGGVRKIRCLYRVRASINYLTEERKWPVATIGYPVFIADRD